MCSSEWQTACPLSILRGKTKHLGQIQIGIKYSVAFSLIHCSEINRLTNFNWSMLKLAYYSSSKITPDDKKKRYDFEMEAFSSTSNILAKSLSNL